jgi:hypothetical protein
MNDSTKRKPPITNKTNFWPLVVYVLLSVNNAIIQAHLFQGTRTEKSFEQWLSLLASTEPLGKLSKQVCAIDVLNSNRID